MPKKNRIRAKDLSRIYPLLTGDNRTDWALWQLTTILAEIANYSIGNKNDDGMSFQQTTSETSTEWMGL